jgi:bifunctional UDP-N-acetylglucosamine pyrophosphorylase/glucosamine-1-phosphate N-acetyltransferase
MSSIDLPIATIILAAGKGTRMKSPLPKVLHQILGKPMINYVVEQAQAVSDRIVVVVGHQKELVKEELNKTFSSIEYADQDQQLGTGHAIMQTHDLLGDFPGLILILSGDSPLITKETLQQLIKHHIKEEAVATVLINYVIDSKGYGRVLMNAMGEFEEIVEQKDIDDPEIEKICSINTGFYLFDAKKLYEALPKINNNNNQKEYYLPDVLKVLKDDNKIQCFKCESMTETNGINTPEQLKTCEVLMRIHNMK